MLELGVVRPSPSPYVSPLHVVPKATPGDGRGRVEITVCSTTPLFRNAAQIFQWFIDTVTK